MRINIYHLRMRVIIKKSPCWNSEFEALQNCLSSNQDILKILSQAKEDWFHHQNHNFDIHLTYIYSVRSFIWRKSWRFCLKWMVWYRNSYIISYEKYQIINYFGFLLQFWINLTAQPHYHIRRLFFRVTYQYVYATKNIFNKMTVCICNISICIYNVSILYK